MYARGRIDTRQPVNWQFPPNAGTLAWWLPLPGRGGGGKLFDLTGRYPGTLAGGVTWAAGEGGAAALSFNGSSGAVNVGGVSALNLSRSFSLAVRFRLTSTASFYTLLSYGNSGFNFRVNTAKLNFLKSQIADIAYGSTTLSANVWYTGGFTMDASGNGAFYLDGRPDGTFSTAQTFGGSQQFSLGTDYQGNGVGQGWFSGLISDARVVGRELSAADHAALHDQMRMGHPDALRRAPAAWLGAPVSPPPPPPAGSGFPAAVVGGGYGW